jgi:hypothetical protein
MCKFLRLAAGVCCLGVLALGVICVDPACLIHFPPGCDPDSRVSVADEVARHEHLNQQEAALRRQRQAKRTVAAEVIARRRSLAEAIEEFRALDREWPKLGPPPHWPGVLGISAEEWSGRDVLYFVQLVLADRPDEAAAVADLLEKELRELVAEWSKRRLAPAEPRAERSR